MMAHDSRPSFQLLRIRPDDAQGRTDTISVLTRELAKHEEHYPNIERWIDKKVIPGLRTGERVAYIGFKDDQAILVAILKLGQRSKFCHLSIKEGFRDGRYGTLLFSLMATEVRKVASEIHFTLPESLWIQEKEFFQSFGFMNAELAHQQYRLFEDELRCSARFKDVWSKVMGHLPAVLSSASIGGFGSSEGVVLSVHEKHAKAIMEGRKKVEVRRRFSERWCGRRAGVYATGGLGALVGEVTISDVVRGSPSELWEQFGPEMGCSYRSFSQYVGGRAEIFAIKLSDAKPYIAPVSLPQLGHILGEHLLSPPQSYCTYGDNDKWAQALTVAALLHGVGDLRSYRGSMSGLSNVRYSPKTGERQKKNVAVDVKQYSLDL